MGQIEDGNDQKRTGSSHGAGEADFSRNVLYEGKLLNCRFPVFQQPIHSSISPILENASIKVFGTESFPWQNPILYIASSRLPENWRSQSEFAAAVRVILDQYLTRDLSLVCTLESPIFDLVHFLSVRQNWPLISVSTGLAKNKNREKRLGSMFGGLHIDVYWQHQSRMEASSKKLSLSDFICFVLAKEVRILLVKRNGNLFRLVRFFVNAEKKFYILESSPFRKSPGKTWEKQANVISWLIPKSEAKKPDHLDHESIAGSALPWPKDGFAGFLVHHTRGNYFHWPQESPFRFWERWLWGTNRNGTSLQTLVKILVEQRLRACGRLIPGGVPMVCMSERDPRDSSRSPIYRNHLRRWDWLPFGIGIEENFLKTIGCRKVKYVIDLGIEDSQWTHPAFSFDKNGEVQIDWRKEREHRVPNDIDLKNLRSDQAFVFADCRRSAEKVAPFSRFPVYYFLDGSQEKCVER